MPSFNTRQQAPSQLPTSLLPQYTALIARIAYATAEIAIRRLRNEMSSLSDLPSEVRKLIYQFALIQPGPVELQTPQWDTHAFHHPLFAVSHGVRSDALEAFYTANCFLWTIDTSRENLSDPASYPGMGDTASWWPSLGDRPLDDGVTPALPWIYPDLRKHLRHLNLNIYLPADSRAPPGSHATIPQTPLSSAAFNLRHDLERLVLALDHGRTLDTVQLLFMTKAANRGSTVVNVRALEALAEMEVRGKVSVSVGLNLKTVAQNIHNLRLEQCMKNAC